MINEFFSSLPKTILKEVTTLDVVPPSEDCNKQINDLLKRTVLLGGKRLRPLLTFLMGELFNVPGESLKHYARAVELVHAASLSHDDVIDNAQMRRGLPSINVIGSNKKAILTGDYLLADVIVHLTQEGNLKLVREMSYVIRDLAEGEWIQLEAAQTRDYSWDVIETIAKKKTSSVMSYCCLAPAVIAGYSDDIVSLAKDFGVQLGLGFQFMDDALDFKKNSEKGVKTDLKNGVVNAVVYRWFKKHPKNFDLYKKGEVSLESLEDKIDGPSLLEATSEVEALALEKLENCKGILKEVSTHLTGSNKDSFLKTLPVMETVVDFLAKRTH